VAGDVHGDQQRPPLALPRLALAQRLAKCPIADRHDEPGLSAAAMNLIGGTYSPPRGFQRSSASSR
jgi:hypothetical protein